MEQTQTPPPSDSYCGKNSLQVFIRQGPQVYFLTITMATQMKKADETSLASFDMQHPLSHDSLGF